MPSVRKMISFSPLGALLLERATQSSRARAGGDYLSAVLAQRYHQWQSALTYWDAHLPRERLLAQLQALAGYAPPVAGAARSYAAHLPEDARDRLASDPIAADAFCYLALEFAAGNQELLLALNTPKETTP